MKLTLPERFARSLLGLSFTLVLLGFAAPAAAVHPRGNAKDEPFVELMDNLGDHSHAITTGDPVAQRYFDQGLRLMYAFNHAEAIRSFRAATQVDPDCAMAHWGIALSLGPNYNLAADAEQSKAAHAAVQQAKKLSGGAKPHEVAFIDALLLRYAETPPDDRTPLDRAYADAMRKVAAQHPDNLDVQVLFAESLMDLRPWKLWTKDGKAEPGTDEVLAILEGVLAKNPNHPGANHFYIHAVEASPAPERALPCAERLGGLMPGAGHMVHMPAHIFFRLGRYRDAAVSNERAIVADEAYITRFKPEGPYPMMYYPHNIHFLWACQMMEGRAEDAIRSGSQVSAKLPDEMVEKMPLIEGFVPTRLFALARFHKWDQILAEKSPNEKFTYAKGIWHYARGLAYAGQGKRSEAQAEADKLHAILAATPPDKMLMQHHAQDLLAIAANHLDGALLGDAGKVDEAAAKLRLAVDQADKLQYDEPPPWYLPMRQPLGALLLAANRPTEAEAAYRADLKIYAENGWSLAGLVKALRAQKREAEATEAEARFKKAWPNADVEPF